MPVNIKSDQIARDPLKGALQARSAERRNRLRRESTFEGRAPAPRNDLRPDLGWAEIAIAKLKPPKRNVRKYGPDDIAEVANAIRQFGLSAPIIVGRGNQLIDGTVVVEAAKSLGLTTLPAVRVEHLDPDQERALRLLLNRMGHKREHDVDALQAELEELEALCVPICGLGYSDAELDQILQAPLTSSRMAVAEPDNPKVAVTRLSDKWLLGEHVLLCGDAKDSGDWNTLLGDEKARMVLTDPPYAVAVGKVVSTKHRDFVEGGGDMDDESFKALFNATFTAAKDALVAGGMLFSFMDWKHVSDLIVIGKGLGLEHMNLVTWAKHQGGMGGFYRSQSEFVVALKKPGKHKNNIQLGKFGRDRTNVWQYAGAGTSGSSARAMLKDHPTPKPVELLVDAIMDVTDREDIVVDPFGGSGSTLIAAEQAGRRARLIELDPLYCDLTILRWLDATNGTVILAATGQSYAEVAAQRAGQTLETIDAR